MVEIQTGCTIVFGTSGFSAEILDITPYFLSRESVQTSHQGTTGAHTHEPTKLHDSGELTYTVHHDPGDDIPIDQDPETITVTYASGATDSFTGFMTGYDPSGQLEDKITADVTVKISGEIIRSS